MFEHEFYPTPPELAKRLIDDDLMLSVKTVLDPSAGKGDLLSAMNTRFRDRWSYSRDYRQYDCYAVEIDPDLRAILKEKSYRLIGSDFLSCKLYSQFDLILMNPPFSCGEKHLLKALEITSTMRCRAFSGIRQYNYYVKPRTSKYGIYERNETSCLNVYVGIAEIGL